MYHTKRQSGAAGIIKKGSKVKSGFTGNGKGYAAAGEHKENDRGNY